MLHPRVQDKLEFKELALEIEADNKRRTLIACGTAAVGALVVAKYSDEFQWAQKTFRGLYIEPKAEVRPPASCRRAPFGCPPMRHRWRQNNAFQDDGRVTTCLSPRRLPARRHTARRLILRCPMPGPFQLTPIARP